MATATQGRNTGGRRRTMTTKTTAQQPATTTDEAAKLPPVMTIERKAGPVDILDTGLEDHTWHYVWVNKDDSLVISSYYNDGYRFVRFADVEEHFKQDEMRSFLYTEDVNGWVSFGTQERLMKIPQEVYRNRLSAALGNSTTANAEQKARSLLEQGIEQGKYDGSIEPSAKLSADSDSGTTTTKTLEIEEGDK